MRKLKVLFISLASLALLFNACKSNSTSNSPSNGPGNSYFPNSNGTSYKYSVTKTDSAKNTTSGTRSTTYSGTTTLNGVVYQNEIDTLSFSGLSFVTNSLFVKTGDTVYFAIDTSGLSQVIPDSLRQYITISSGIKAFQFPFVQNTSWQVFNLGLNISGFAVNLVSVSGTYIGTEQVPLNLTSGATNMSAAKIQYTLTLKIPTANPLVFNTKTYTAFAWMANNVGMIQMEGNGAILDAFTGAGINFADTTSNITQSLISYNIK